MSLVSKSPEAFEGERRCGTGSSGLGPEVVNSVTSSGGEGGLRERRAVSVTGGDLEDLDLAEVAPPQMSMSSGGTDSMSKR